MKQENMVYRMDNLFMLNTKQYSRTLLVLMAILVLGSGCAKKPVQTYTKPQIGSACVPAESLNLSIVETAKTNIGVHYKPGGNSPENGFDCSGFVLWTYQQCGIPLPRTSREQMKVGREVPKSQLKPGDLVAFKISNRRGYHTGIYSGNGKFIHSPSSGKCVSEEDMNAAYWKKRFITARRLKALE